MYNYAPTSVGLHTIFTIMHLPVTLTNYILAELWLFHQGNAGHKIQIWKLKNVKISSRTSLKEWDI